MFQYFFVITFYVLNLFFRAVYTHIRATTGVPRQPYEGCTYCFIHEAHTNVRFISCDGHQLYERGVDLEVEGVRYIEMHHGPAAYVLGPPPSRGRDLELEGGVMHATSSTYTSPETPTCEVPSNGVVEISSYPEAVSTLHCALENGADLHANKCQKIQHYRARSTEERRRIRRKKKNAK